MFRNYLKVALRNMARNKGYTSINILSLAIGMAATLLILLFVYDELSYDRYHENVNRIVRVTRAWVNQDGETSLHLGHVAPPFAPLLENDFGQIIEHGVRFMSDDPLIIYEDKRIEENRTFIADADVFSVFSWELLKGDPATALIEPNSVVMTESTARKYFGDEDPIGKQINYSNLVDMKVTGVSRDVPLNSHFKWDILVSWQGWENLIGRDNLMKNFGSNNYATYLLLPEGYNYKDLQSQLPEFLNRHMQVAGDGRKPSEYNYLTLWPITDIHLHSHLDSEVEANGNITYIYIYGIIALFILIIACINFMNLSTARSAKRAREVGLRKVLGAYKIALVRQFIFESILFAVFGMLSATIIVMLVLPVFNQFIDKGLSLAQGNFALPLLVLITIIVGVVAGSYPAFYLSSFQPATILKGSIKATGKKFNLRSLLVVLQFAISIALIIGVGIVSHQLRFMRSKDLGFDQDNLIILPVNQTIYGDYESIKQRLEAQPGIDGVSLSSRIPSGRLLDSQGTTAEVDGDMKQINFRVADVHIDFSFIDDFGISLAAGRNFDPERASDSTTAFMLNEAAVKAIGWRSNEEAIDKKLNYGNRTGQVIGIVKDFHFESLHQEIAPIVFLITSGRSRNLAVKIKDGYETEVIPYLREQWSFLNPGFPFTSYYVDQRFSQQYSNEDRLNTVIRVFSALAIFIAAMGLFGLSSFIAEQRIKEIGIRKVMGATLPQILGLLTKGITGLVLVSCLIAAPLAYYIMHKWLLNFAYADSIKFIPFMGAFGFAILIAWITMSFQTIKASLANPVDSLRYE